ncbi:ectopic P granules protein 5 homolog isoform X4 [Dysidea avara]|uniref:ectopic P granules protein 5 homolog isoform X4 n=1 Tax=Dysidea avara TaxID=196820 RepID=UPI00331C2EDA
MLGVASTGAISRQKSTPWTFIEEDLEEEENEDHHLLLLKESDFTEFFDQFPLNDVFQYILHITDNDYYQVELTSSYSMLRLISFSTCVIRLLGTAFSTLRLQRYKEFNKRIGRCIWLIVQFVADHWLAYKSYQVEQLGLQMNQFPYSVLANELRYTLNRLQLEVDYFILRATRWIMMGHKLGAWQFMADMPYSV